ncbi:polysaccharide lyase family 7 protein [Nevskia ramosa]|uniref:polysaccharide lyase family 7 protein n=1 Tax=Nevskia ramosa TaxID=64002 RepID=UPI00146F75C0|nr:polysaccharide lyase family 7 protein [Nevskia ramosa]
MNTGSYRINSGAFTSAPGTIANGDKVTLRLDASSSYSAAVTQTLSIEGQPNRIFRVITLETDPNPPPPPPVVVPEPVAIRWSAYGKLTLPVDQDGKAGADEIEASALDNYSSTYWYQPTSGQRAQSGYSATGGETVFWTPVNGDGTTESSSYARTEMREQVVSGNNRINWGLAGTHIQKGTVVVSQLPTAISSTSKTFLVFGQMHSVDNSPPMKMIFQRLPNGTTEVMSNYNTKRAGGASQNSTVRVPIRIGEKFTYEIRLIDGTITTLVNNIVLDVRDMSSGWNGAQLFFKAGSYLGNNAQTATGYGEVVYSTFEVVHQ